MTMEYVFGKLREVPGDEQHLPSVLAACCILHTIRGKGVHHTNGWEAKVQRFSENYKAPERLLLQTAANHRGAGVPSAPTSKLGAKLLKRMFIMHCVQIVSVCQDFLKWKFILLFHAVHNGL